MIYNYTDVLKDKKNYDERIDKLCEIAVIVQVRIGETPIVRNAWLKAQKLKIHGCIYKITDGVCPNISVSPESLENSKSLASKNVRSTAQNRSR